MKSRIIIKVPISELEQSTKRNIKSMLEKDSGNAYPMNELLGKFPKKNYMQIYSELKKLRKEGLIDSGRKGPTMYYWWKAK